MSIPGIRIVAVIRDPAEWLWSSLLRCLEHLEVDKQQVLELWRGLTVLRSATSSASSHVLTERASNYSTVPLQRQSGHLQELAIWRLGVPLDEAHALSAGAIEKIASKLHRRGQLLLIDFQWVRLGCRQLFSRLLQGLGLRLGGCSGRRMLPHNVRRRTSHPLSGEALELAVSFRQRHCEEYATAATVLAAHGVLAVARGSSKVSGKAEKSGPCVPSMEQAIVSSCNLSMNQDLLRR